MDKLQPELEAAYAFVDSMVARADAHQGGAPLWHGWALREAYLAGVSAGMEKAAGIADDHECGGPDDISCWGQNCGMLICAAIRAAIQKDGRIKQTPYGPAILLDDVRDAERYRWLREQHWNEAPLCVVARPRDAVKLGYDCPSLDRLDAAIDAAMQKE